MEIRLLIAYAIIAIMIAGAIALIVLAKRRHHERQRVMKGKRRSKR